MQQQQRRLYASVIGVVAVLAIATTLLPWVSLQTLGTQVTWNGLGRTSDVLLAENGIGPHPYGWWVVAAAFVAILATGLLLSSGKVIDKITAPVLWLAAVAALAATAVPITALADPAWLMGDFLDQLGPRGLVDLIGGEFLVVPVLGFTIGSLIILALLAAATALIVRPIRLRVRISIDRGTDTKKQPTPARTAPAVRDDEPAAEDVDPEADEADTTVDEDPVDADSADEDSSDEEPADEEPADEEPAEAGATRSAGSPPSE
ncbi:hypothetical protein ACFQNE_17505 [Gordonia phosphorivorans]|uniref:Uncharacterized protein n=1 Tax=Gordonia phosphorivorans TaxID=1056982 RepID=A0ABV6HB25_9ACTN